MTIYNTASDAANTAVRAFLTKVGEYYLGRTFNTGSGKARDDWKRIREQVFGGQCAYCGDPTENPQMEHLVMFSRSEFGLHHPGNVVPACRTCNRRHRNPDQTYVTWEEQLEMVCAARGEKDKVTERKGRILVHMKKQGYPSFSREEASSIRLIAENLYKNIQAESDRSLDMYRQLHEAFVKP